MDEEEQLIISKMNTLIKKILKFDEETDID